MNKPLSNCCNAPMSEVGSGDFDDADEVCTMHWECKVCQKPCDPKLTTEYESTDPCLPDDYDRGYKDGRKQAANLMRQVRQEAVEETIRIVEDYKIFAKVLHKGAHENNQNMFLYDAHSRIVACDHLLVKIKDLLEPSTIE